jgi:hypothetical protein
MVSKHQSHEQRGVLSFAVDSTELHLIHSLIMGVTITTTTLAGTMGSFADQRLTFAIDSYSLHYDLRRSVQSLAIRSSIPGLRVCAARVRQLTTSIPLWVAIRYSKPRLGGSHPSNNVPTFPSSQRNQCLPPRTASWTNARVALRGFPQGRTEIAEYWALLPVQKFLCRWLCAMISW